MVGRGLGRGLKPPGTPRMWERMCGLFPATKAIRAWKDFRDYSYLICRLGSMWAPVFGAKPRPSLSAMPPWKQQGWLRGGGGG